RCLVAIGATVVAKPEDGRIAVEAPGWRPDLKQEVDLIEEVARIHGYQNLPTELRAARVGSLADAPIELAAAEGRRGLTGLGLLEAATLPMTATGASDAVRLLNPLSASHGYLRRALLPGLVREVEANWKNHMRDVRLFEIGTAFRTQTGQRPLETR